MKIQDVDYVFSKPCMVDLTSEAHFDFILALLEQEEHLQTMLEILPESPETVYLQGLHERTMVLLDILRNSYSVPLAIYWEIQEIHTRLSCD